MRPGFSASEFATTPTTDTQVTEKLYDRSRYRYCAYLEQLAPVIPILEPTIFSLGYTIE